MQLATADESNLSNNDPIDEEDIIFLEEAMSDTDDIITVTIDDAHQQSNELKCCGAFISFILLKKDFYSF